ncbi:hypothetical protein CANMA_004387 [Candida margitis]|uniref:uncharacterized protein n=1 Tax=Candida margitis TaxID=1775924 RepID=UPI002226B2A5|nr:uncharacterized protein CANMA_004387 [Candida margitis]KAI5957876.1 hypothetical protein CANMA_004387 [Candida margitis]
MSFKLSTIILLFVLITGICAASLNKVGEYGTYMNPKPRKTAKCEPNDLVKLSTCCNDVLSKLDECKPNDLACECCALQSIDDECYHLCPGNPNTNFLTVLLSDCAEMNEVNACSLPFKKEDPEPPRKSIVKTDEEDPRVLDEAVDASLQSKVYNVESLTKQPHFKNQNPNLSVNDEEKKEAEEEDNQVDTANEAVVVEESAVILVNVSSNYTNSSTVSSLNEQQSGSIGFNLPNMVMLFIFVLLVAIQ